MNPYILVALLAFAGFCGFKLKSYQVDAAELQVQRAKEESRAGAAEAIAKIRISYTTVNKNLQKEIIKETQYVECQHSDEAFKLLQESLEPPK